MQIEQGTLFSLANTLEYELAERFCAEVTPWATSVRWLKTGSEAAEAACRIARMETGRRIILSCGYHGWHSTFMAARAVAPGVPDQFRNCIIDFPYNDLDTLDRILADYKTDIAAIIVEPALHDIPKDGWLEGIRARCTKIGAIMISDELICALRWAKGGGTEYFGVIPDIAIYGKALGAGVPIAAVAGSRELLRHAYLISSTFGGDMLGLTACSAVLDIYNTEPIIKTLWARGKQFQRGFNDLPNRLEVTCDGFPVKPRIRFMLDSEKDNNLAMSLFLQETAKQGILWHPAGGNISAAMTEADIDDAVDKMGSALAVVNRATSSGDWSALHGQPIQPSAFVRKSG